MGKIIAEGRGDVQEVIDFYEYAAGEGRRMFGETVPSELPNKMCLTTRLPVGPVGLITPWNFPMAIPGWKSGAALIAGCSFVLKPSSLTPLCAARFVEVLDEAGFPAGVVNMVTGTGSVVGDGLVAHPDIRVISFTGGVDTGKHVYESAAKKMIKVGLELGGKNPIIAMDDANVDLLMDGVMFGAFGTAGQRCTAASRLIVHQKVYDQVVNELVERAEKIRVGNPIDEKTDMGPVASADQEKKVLEYIDIGRKEGDTLVTGGKKLTGGAYDKGFFIAPTVFAVDRRKRLALEEIFGPVLSVLKAKDFDDAVAIANSVKYGLSSSIYTNDLRWAFRGMEESGVQDLLRFLRGQDPLLDHEFLDRLPGPARLFRDFCGLLVADEEVKGRRDGGARFRVPLQDVDVRANPFDAPVREHAGDVREELHVLREALGRHGHHRAQVEVGMGVGHRDRHVVANHRDADLHDRFGDDRIHLARHDRRTRLDRRKIQLPQARVGSRAQPPEVVRDLDRRHGHGSNRPARFDEGLLGGLCLKVVLRDPAVRVRGRAGLLDDPPPGLRARNG